MSNKNRLNLKSEPTGDQFQDVFSNVSSEDLTNLADPYRNFMKKLKKDVASEETKNSTAHFYSLFRDHFPMGTKDAELVILQMLAAFLREVDDVVNFDESEGIFRSKLEEIIALHDSKKEDDLEF